MTPLLMLTLVESKLLLRTWGWLFVIGIPVFNLLVFGVPFRLSDPAADLRVVAAVSLPVALGLVGLYMVPATLAAYRERGLLRRLSTTPVSPRALLAAQLTVQLALAAVTGALLLLAAYLMLGVRPPGQWGLFALVFALGTAALFAGGLVIAAVAPSGQAANGLGVVLYFPLAFLAGLLLPKDLMPDWLARAGEFTPLGAFRQAAQDVWLGLPPDPLHLLVLAAFAVLAGLLAARVFRWE